MRGKGDTVAGSIELDRAAKEVFVSPRVPAVAVLKGDFHRRMQVAHGSATCAYGGRGQVAIGKIGLEHGVEIQAGRRELEYSHAVPFHEVQGLEGVGQPVKAVGEAQAGSNIRGGHHGVAKHAVGLERKQG